MSIRIFDNQKVGVADAIKGYLSTSEGFQDYAMMAGCAGDVLYTLDNESKLGSTLGMASAGVNYIAKPMNAVVMAMNTPKAIEEAVEDPTVANVGRAVYSGTGFAGSALSLLNSTASTLWSRVTGALSLSSSAIELTLDITSLIDQCKIERVYNERGVRADVSEALADTRVWRGLSLGKTIGKTCLKVAMVVAPIVAPVVAIVGVVVSAAVSVGMSIAETIYRRCFMTYAPVHPNHLENQGKDLALIRNEKCVIL